MKKSKFIFFVFILLVIGGIVFGVKIVLGSINDEQRTFSHDGYALTLNKNGNKSVPLAFSSGSNYNFKKFDNKISFLSDKKNVKIDEDTVIHYQDKSLLVLKNTVGIDLDNIDSDIIFYYNIFKNTEISYKDGEYSIETKNNGEITFSPLMLRISDSKFLIAGDNVRAMFSNDEIIDYDSYLYVEFIDGQIVKLYNDEEFKQTIVDNVKIVVGDITIDLKDESISKKGEKYISLSNLVIDRDSNVDVLTVEEAEKEETKIEKADVDDKTLNGEVEKKEETKEEDKTSSNSSSVNNNASSEIKDEDEIVSDDKEIKEPVYNVTKLNVTALAVDASIEITDDDALITSPTELSIVENATGNVVFESSLEAGDLSGSISYPDLKPDTEYTLFAKASYKIEDTEYDKNFISKIFRTEALGVSFEKAYATNDSIVVDLTHESYSKVTSATIGIFNTNGELIDYESVAFDGDDKKRIMFRDLDSNTTYMVKLYDILSSGVIVDDGFSQKENISTLKQAPEVSDLDYTVSKSKSAFELEAEKVTDRDYGIKGYKYEVFDARQNMNEEQPVVTIDKDSLGPVTVKVDDNKLHHGIAYTYRLIILFNDNEKDIEYTYTLGTTMQIDGVEFPTVRWEGSKINWEQINGSIIVEDPSSTVMSDSYKVVYKNSVDAYETKTITASTDRYTIPITVNYLRADETYTFDVYASINLQDGNPTVTETYIGSVKVQTKKPNSFTGLFSTNSSLDDVFSINFKLNDDTDDASFEADTLSSLTFTLYQGSTIDGKVEAVIKDTDKNDDEYSSTLKPKFYDNTAVINAAFFNAQNSDFKQKTYTLVVSDAYDYTKYDTNIIPIKNNIFQFEVNNYVPSIPDPNEPQLTVNEILNKTSESFGLSHDDNLDGNTTVGYHVVANFDNASKTAKYLVYHVWRKNPVSGQFEMLPNLDRRVNIDSSGNINPIIFSVENGTDESVLDSDALRRGNEYYFSFDAYLDIDNDGSIETHYPTDIDSNVVLKSAPVAPNKQRSIFQVYPSVSDNTSFTWKYKATDIDHAIADNKLHAFRNAETSPISSSNITVNNDSFEEVKFTNLAAGNVLTIRKNEKLLKTEGTEYSTLTSQYFYGYKSSLGLKYRIDTDVNKIKLKIDTSSANADKLISSISNVDVVITPTDPAKLASLGVKTLEKLTLSTQNDITIDYMDISDYISTPIKIEMIAYYDTGNTGFDINSTYKAVQKGSYENIGNYYRISSSRIMQASNLSGNMMSVTPDMNAKQLSLTNLNENSAIINFNIDNTGVVYENNNLLLKEIKTETLASDNKITQFDYIIPGISLYKGNKIDVASFLTSVKLNATLHSVNYSNIRENLIYYDLFETDENGTNAEYISTNSKPIVEFDNPIEITNLKPKTNYYVNFYAYIYSASTGSYEKVYLYDVDKKLVGINYHFHTLSEVGISNITAELVAESYNEKDLVIDYHLDTVLGFDKIKYELFKYTPNGYVRANVTIPDSTSFSNSMSIRATANPSPNNDIVYEGTYKILMTPVGTYTENGVEKTIELGTYSQEFSLEKYKEPFIGISPGKTDNSIYFRVSINDESKVIVNGKYRYQLLDMNNNVIASSGDLNINSINNRFNFTKANYPQLEEGERYKFVITTKADYYNKNISSNFEQIIKSREMTFGGDIYLGSVILQNSTDETGTQLNLIFSDSYNLDRINQVKYTVSSMGTNYYFSPDIQSFTTRYEPSTGLYYYSILINDPEYLPNVVYTITASFYRNNSLVDSIELDYFEGNES